MTAGALAVVAVAVFFASGVQVIAGFAFGLLSVPLMTLVIPTRQAVVVSALVGFTVSAWQAWRGRHDVDRPTVRQMTIAAYIGMPLGLVVFLAVSDTTLQILLGVAIIGAVVFLASRRDISHVDRRLEYAAGFLSGVLNTSLSTNGPPLVFALQSRHLTPARFRGTISTVFTACNVGALSLFLAAGKVNRDGLIATAVAFPAMLLGQAAGWPLRRHVDGERFRRLVLLLLVLAALSVIVSGLT
jgi:uncharacterized membrane protein YfcA